MKKLFIWPGFVNEQIVKDLLTDFEVDIISRSNINNTYLKNKNILLFIKENFQDEITGYLNKNNFLVFYLKKINDFEKYQNHNIHFVGAPIHANKLLYLVKNYFENSIENFNDLKIFGETITNTNTEKFCFLTNLERLIILELIKNKSISREYFLENILGLKKNIETKTIESHLTRIRKKLLQIESKTQVFSRGDKFFLSS